MNEPENFTITLPLGTCDDYTLSIIRHFIENYDNKILVIFKEKEPKDYIVHPKVKYVKNGVEKNFAKIFNQCIKEADTEYIFFNNWKYKPTYEDFLYGVNQLNKGFGWVDLRPVMGISLFSKHLVSKIGFIDERYHQSNEVDWDLICTLKHFDIAYCGQFIVPIQKQLSMQQGPNTNAFYDNIQKFYVKWKDTPNGFQRLVQEKNFKDKNMYKNVYSERSYLKFKESIIEDEYYIKRCNLTNCGLNLNYLKTEDELKILFKTVLD